MPDERMLLVNGVAATMAGPDYGHIVDAAIACENGRIAWVGNRTDCPAQYKSFPHHDLGERLVTPALIDCHTHIVHGGNRANEFEMRLKGASYEEVARAGGGIYAQRNRRRTCCRGPAPHRCHDRRGRVGD
jgi:imidazolonepropionase